MLSLVTWGSHRCEWLGRHLLRWSLIHCCCILHSTPEHRKEKSYSVKHTQKKTMVLSYRDILRIMNLCNKSVSAVHHQSKVSKSNPHWLSVLPSVAGFVVISQKQSNEAESAVADPLCDTSPPTGKHNDHDIWDYWFCLSWSIRGGGYALTPTTLIHSSWAQRSGRSCVTWSWWSKNVLIHALEPASQTFTLLSDELGEAEDRLFLTLFISSVSGGKAVIYLKFYLETKWVSSGEKATLRTQDPCPLSVPAKLACCLEKKITSVDLHLFYSVYILLHFCVGKTQVLLFRSFRLNSHIINFDVTVVRGCDQQLGVRGECERSDGHGVTCRERNQSVCIKSSSLTLKSTVVILDWAIWAQLTFQRMEKFPSGDIENIDDSIDRSAGQILSIRALRGDQVIQSIIDESIFHRFNKHVIIARCETFELSQK